MRRVFSLLSVLILLPSVASASAIELITNGDFETGTFVGWTVNNQGNGNWFIDAPGTGTPVSNHPTLGTPANGNDYAVTDQTGPGLHALHQAFTVAAGTNVMLSFDLFANDYDNGPIVNPAGLTLAAGANQHARVDILSNGSGPFDTGAAVLQNFYLGVDPGPDPHPFTHYVFDITGLVGGGGTFILRFAEVDNQGFFNLGVDNVSISQTAVPEPTSLLLFGSGAAAAMVIARRRRKSV